MRDMRKNKRMLAEDVTITSKTSDQFRTTVAQAWKRVYSPELPMLLDANVSMAGRLPGSPQGVGEIQYAVVDGSQGRLLVAAEVVEYEHERRALTRSMTVGAEPIWIETTLEPLDEGRIRLSHEWRSTCPKGTNAAVAESYRLELERMAEQTGTQLRRLFA